MRTTELTANWERQIVPPSSSHPYDREERRLKLGEGTKFGKVDPNETSILVRDAIRDLSLSNVYRDKHFELEIDKARLNMRYRSFIVAFLVLCLGVLVAFNAPTANAASKEQMTYDEIVGTGLANKCPEISAFTRGTIPLEPGKTYTVTDLCLEPQQYFVKEEPASKRKAAEFVEGKLLTRETTSLEQISGKIAIGDNGVVTLIEEEGIDFQPITVQLPGGEQFPFFFTIKNLVAKTEPGFNAINSSADFKGAFKVPSYRGSGFLDPKGRGLATGYDSAVALPAAADEYVGSTVKQTPIGKGEISLQVAKVDGETGEIAGIFESIQPSDTDLGVKEAVDVKIRGIFYARVAPES